MPMAMIVISFDGGSRRFRAEIPLTPAVQISQTTSQFPKTVKIGTNKRGTTVQNCRKPAKKLSQRGQIALEILS